jgi:glutamate synthase domain-containing protein 2
MYGNVGNKVRTQPRKRINVPKKTVIQPVYDYNTQEFVEPVVMSKPALKRCNTGCPREEGEVSDKDEDDDVGF